MAPCWFVWSVIRAFTWNNLEQILGNDYSDTIHRCRRHGASIVVPSMFRDVMLGGWSLSAAFQSIVWTWEIWCALLVLHLLVEKNSAVEFWHDNWIAWLCLKNSLPMAHTSSTSAIMYCLWCQDVYATLWKVMNVLTSFLCWTRKYFVTHWPHF